jgi:hypothetical protein
MSKGYRNSLSNEIWQLEPRHCGEHPGAFKQTRPLNPPLARPLLLETAATLSSLT